MNSLPKTFDEGRLREAALVVFFAIGQAFAIGVAAFATRDVFSALHSDKAPAQEAFILLGFAGCTVAFLHVLSRIYAEALGQSYAKSLRRVLYRHIAGMSDSDVSQKRLGALSLRFVGDLSAARGWVGLGVTRLISASVVLPGAAFAFYLLDPKLALAGTIPVVLALIISLGLAVRLGGLHRSLRSRRANIAIAMMERIAISPALDLAGRTDKELEKLDADSTALRQEATARVTRLSILRAMPQLGVAIGGVIILWTAHVSSIPAASAAGALAILGILAMPLRELAGVWDRFCSWRIASAKCLFLLERGSHLRSFEPRGKPVPVDFTDVSFRGLQVNAKIPAGATVFVTGKAGSGKSSLLSLAAGHDRPESGKISYGSDNDSLPRIVYISDQALIMQGSFRKAVTLGIEPRPKKKDIHKVLRYYGLKPLLERIGGITGRIHEGGRTISAGEALRISLARALLTQPDLIIIDSMQLESEARKSKLIERLQKNTNATLLIAGSPRHITSPTMTLQICSENVNLSTSSANISLVQVAA